MGNLHITVGQIGVLTHVLLIIRIDFRKLLTGLLF